MKTIGLLIDLYKDTYVMDYCLIRIILKKDLNLPVLDKNIE